MKPNSTYDYFAGDIIKVWDAILQQKKCHYYYYEEKKSEDKFFTSLFESKEKMSPKWAAGIVTDDKNKLLDFTATGSEIKYSVSICQAVDPHEDLTYLVRAWGQVQQWQLSKTPKIKKHAILFPYHQGPHHWNLGVLWLTFSEFKEVSDPLPTLTKIELDIYEPLYPIGYLSTIFLNKLKQPPFSFDNIAWNVVPTGQQSDNTSCGPISATNGTHFLGYNLKKQSLLSISHPNYAIVTRGWHVKLIGDHFAAIQHEEQVGFSSKDISADVTQRLEIKKRLNDYIKKLTDLEQQEVKTLFNQLLQDNILQDDIARGVYQAIKAFFKKHQAELIKSLLEKPINGITNLFEYFLKESDGWQDNAIDILYAIASDSIQQISAEQKGKSKPPYDKRSTLAKAFPGPLYQCLLALHHMLLLTQTKTEFAIRMEDANSGAFDDIIIQANNQIEYIQIKHKSEKGDQYEWKDFINSSGDIELDKYFDDWYLFIKTGLDTAATKKFTFHSSGQLDTETKKYVQYDHDKKCYFFKKIMTAFRITNKPPTQEEIKNEVVIYPKLMVKKNSGNKSQCQGFYLYFIDTDKLQRREITINELSPEVQQSFINFIDKKEALIPSAEKEIQYLIYRECFMEAVISKIAKNAKICNQQFFQEKVIDFFKKNKKRMLEKDKKEAGGNNPTLAELRNRYKGYQGKKWESLTPAAINISIAEFLEGLQLKFAQDHISELEQKVREQVKNFIKEEVSDQNVFHAFVMETHRWLCNMQTTPWNNRIVFEKLENFKKRYIEIVHKIGEAQLSFRQINHLAFYRLYNLFAREFNTQFQEQVKALLGKKEGELLLLSAKEENEGSILIEQYLQSNFNSLWFGQYIYFDGRYLAIKSLNLAEEKELKLIVIDRVDEWINRAPVIGELWEALNRLLEKGKKLILIGSEKTTHELHKRFSSKLSIFPFNLKPLAKEDATRIIQQLGGNTIVTIGGKAFDLSQADWQPQSSVMQVFSHLPTLVHALTASSSNFSKKVTTPIPLMLEEQISLYPFSALLNYLTDYRQPIAMIISSKEEFSTLQSQLPRFSNLMITADQLLNQEFKDLKGWITKNKQKDLDLFKEGRLTILVDCRQQTIDCEILMNLLKYSRLIVLTTKEDYTTIIPVIKLIYKGKITEVKETKETQETIFEFCSWHPAQEKIKRLSKTISREAGEEYRQLALLATQAGHVVICAQGGSGKSTVARALYDNWCNENSHFPDYWLVFINLGSLKEIDANKKLIDLIKDAYALQEVPWQLSLLEYELQQKRVIFILDGWDELQPYQKRQLKELIKKFIHYEKVIWTTRPSEVLNLPALPRKQFNLRQFNKVKIKQFLQDRFSKSAEFTKQAMNYLASPSNQDLLDLVSLPLHCHLLCEIWQPHYQLFLQDQSTPFPWESAKKFNKITLYQEFVKARLWRYLLMISKVDLQTSAAFDLKDRVYLLCSRHLLKLQKIAYHHSFTHKSNSLYQEFPDRDLQKTAIVFSSELAQLGEHATLPNKSMISFTFTHKTYEEYLSAVALAQQLVKGDQKKSVANIIKTYRYHPDYRLRWQFLAAIVSYGDPIVPKAKMVLGRFWQLLLAEPRDLIGVAENELVRACISHTCFDDEKLIDSDQKIIDQLRPLQKLSENSAISQVSVVAQESNLEGKKTESKEAPKKQEAVIINFKEISLTGLFNARIQKLEELAGIHYELTEKLKFLRWLNDQYSQQLYYGEPIKMVCNVIENIVKRILNDAEKDRYEFFHHSDILVITGNVIGHRESEDSFSFIEIMQPSQEQVQQLLDLLSKKNISQALIKAVLTCLMQTKKNMKELSSAPLHKILADEKESTIRKLACYGILRQYDEQYDDKIFYLLLELLKKEIDNLPIVFSVIKQLGYISSAVRGELIKIIYTQCLHSMQQRLSSKSILSKDLTKECLLFLDYCSALDDEILKLLFDKQQDNGYWDCDVVFPVLDQFKNTFNLEIFHYLNKKHKGDYSWKINPYTFLQNSMQLFANITDKWSRGLILKEILVLYKKEFNIGFENIEPLELMRLTLEIYAEAVKEDNKNLFQNAVQFIFDYCSRLKIALVIEDDSVSLCFDKETFTINNFMSTQQLAEQILVIRRTVDPADFPLQLLQDPVPMELDDSDEDFHELVFKKAKIQPSATVGPALFVNKKLLAVSDSFQPEMADLLSNS